MYKYTIELKIYDTEVNVYYDELRYDGFSVADDKNAIVKYLQSVIDDIDIILKGNN